MGTKQLYLPASVKSGGVALPRQMESEVLREQGSLLREVERVTDALEFYKRELKKIDEHLTIVMAKPNTTVDGLKPGYYHILRLRPGHSTYIKPVENPDGTWRDLDSYVFALAGEDDLWNDRLQREKRRKARKAEEARLRQIQREREDRAREFDERVKSAMNASILVPRGITK